MKMETIWRLYQVKRDKNILKFINHFTLNGKQIQVIECFTCGCCYWFAHILYSRFGEVDEYGNPCEHSNIYYDEVENHFCYYDEITDKFYDITGDITGKYDMKPWYELVHKDELLFNRIVRDCINFDEEEN